MPNSTQFRSFFGETIFNSKYKHEGATTWAELAKTLAQQVCGKYFTRSELAEIEYYIASMKFIPGGRYLYYAGRPNPFFNNCYLLRSEEDTREDWANLSWKAESCLMTGGGIGNDYSVYREEGAPIERTGGKASGPIPKMEMVNEMGRRAMQGGSRRSAIYGSLNWQHPDAEKFLKIKNWENYVIPGTILTLKDIKERDFNWPAPLDMTNISLNYDDAFLAALKKNKLPKTFLQNVRQALRTAEPGFSFNFGAKSRETLRNACCEVTSEDDSDVCNLGSVNMSVIENHQEFRDVVALATKFLLCGTLEAKLPYEKVERVREKNRRLGLGLMGVHEWLIMRSQRYEVGEELHGWLQTYRDESDEASRSFADQLGISRPVANRAIAPTGTIGILAGTTTGIEPILACAYKRRYLKNGTEWHYQFVVDSTAKGVVERSGANPDEIETAMDLAVTPEKRIKFQADVQDYVDMAISSTINLPAWGTPHNNPDRVEDFAQLIARYAPRLRGLTVYPDSARGGQPISPVPYGEAVAKEGEEVREEAFDVCEATRGGFCGS